MFLNGEVQGCDEPRGYGILVTGSAIGTSDSLLLELEFSVTDPLAYILVRIP